MKKVIIVFLFIVGFLLTFFYFIPAFRGDIAVSPAVTFGPVGIRWYGLIMAASILTGYFVARRYSWRFGIDKKEMDNVTFWLVIAGILGARLYFVLFAFEYYQSQPLEILKLWQGGLSIYGAIIGGLLFLLFYSRKKAYDKTQLLDLVALAVPIAQAVGRLGNFFNQEAYGTSTNLPWRMYVAATGQFHHPVFLYEALGNLAIFALLIRMVGRHRSGTIALVYLVAYSLLRFFLEPLRMDSVFVYGFRADQVMAFVIIVLSGLVFLKQNRIEK